MGHAHAPAHPHGHLPRTQVPAPVRRGTSALRGPVLIGLVYGLWALAIQRKGEAANTREIVTSIVAGVVVAVVFYLLRHQARGLMDELRAAAWGVSAGLAVGYLHSLVNTTTVLWSGTLGFFTALGVIPFAYYRFAEVEK